MKVSSTGLDSTLPSFFFMAKSEEGGSLFAGDFEYDGGRGQPNPFMVPVNNCPDDLFDNTSPDLRVPQLPWNLQDDWGCERAQDVPVIELERDSESECDDAVGWQGVELVSQEIRSRIVLCESAHQPANIGYRKACRAEEEWNWSLGKIGHSVFSESPVYAARIETKRRATFFACTSTIV